MPRSTPKKDAVLAAGLDKPTSEVIAAVKAASGISVSAAYVDLLKKGQSSGKAKAAKTAKPGEGKTAKPAKVAPTTAAKGGRPKSTGTPSDFIRSMPTATPSEIIEAAKKAGVKFSRGLVYMVRTNAGKRTAKAANGAAPVAAKAAPEAKPAVATAKRKPGRPANAKAKVATASKSDFIRSMPTASSAQVVAAAKEAGLSFDTKYVSTVRSNTRMAAKKKGKAPTKSVPVATASASAVKKRGPGQPKKAVAAGRPSKVAPAVAVTKGSDEQALRMAVAAYAVEHGLAAARAIVEDVGMKIRAAGAQ